MSDLAGVDLYCKEARNIIARAEESIQDLNQNGSCEGRKLIAAQTIAALINLSKLIERHRRRLASETRPDAVDPPAPSKRQWWLIMRLRPRGGDRTIEMST